MFCCLCVSGGGRCNVRTAEYLQPSNANFKRWQAVFINVVTYYPGLWGGRERKREREKRNTAAFDASESLDLLSASLGRVISPLIIKVELLWLGGRGSWVVVCSGEG